MNPDIAVSPLRLERLVRGRTQFQVARRAHLSASRLSLLERGHDTPTEAERAALAAVFGVPESQLFPSASEGAAGDEGSR